jgi:hypothetical protein
MELPDCKFLIKSEIQEIRTVYASHFILFTMLRKTYVKTQQALSEYQVTD